MKVAHMAGSHPPRAYDEVVAFFADGPSREEINAFRLSSETTNRVRQLLLKKSADTLADDEVDELDQCVQLDRLLLLIRSKALEQRSSRGA
jgi:hypothetical protein